MYKYLNLAFLFGATFFVNTAHAAGVFDVPTPQSPGVTYVESTSSDYTFKIPQTDGTFKYYKYNYSIPSGYTAGTQTTYARSNITNKYYTNLSGRAALGFESSSGSYQVIADFFNNSTQMVYLPNKSGLTITKTQGAFINNNSSYWMALIGNWVSANNVQVDVIKNTDSGTSGSGIWAFSNGTSSNSVVANFIANTGYMIFRVDPNVTIQQLSGSFIGNSGGVSGVIDNAGTISRIYDSVFYGNTAGGAYNDIYNIGTIGLSTPTGTSVNFGGSVTGSSGTLNINNDGTYKGGDYIFNNAVSGNTMNLYNGANVKLGSIVQPDSSTTYGKLNTTGFTVDANGGTLDMANGHIDSNSLGAVTLGSNLGLKLDANLSSLSADTLSASSVSGSGKFILNGINLTAAPSTGSGSLSVNIANSTLKNYIIGSSFVSGAQSPYNFATYDSSSGNVVFKTNASIPYDYGTLVATQSGVTFTEGTSSNYDFWLPVDGQKKYYKYTYTKPSGYTAGTATASLNTSIDNKYYQNVSPAYTSGVGVVLYIGSATSVDHVVADFVNNTLNGETLAVGSANSYLGSVFGAFVNNSSSGTLNGRTSGISIGQTLGESHAMNVITGDFIQNSSGSNGAAITMGNFGGSGSYYRVRVESIIGNFIKNSAAKNGGAIWMYQSNDSIGSINSTFLGNTAGTYGGAIYNPGTIENIEANFIGNTAVNNGGAIYNTGTIGSITDSVFYGNTADAGGAIWNEGSITTLAADFISNTSASSGGAIVNREGHTITNLIGNFIGNIASTNGGGAIHQDGVITTIRGDFETNTAATYGGAIWNRENMSIGSITGNFISNTANTGGAIYNGNGAGNGGNGIIGLLADTQDIVFYGNADSTGYNDIYNYKSTINMNAATGKSISFGGSITGSSGIVNINNDSTASNRGGRYIFNNTVSGNRFNLYSFGAIC